MLQPELHLRRVSKLLPANPCRNLQCVVPSSRKASRGWFGQQGARIVERRSGDCWFETRSGAGFEQVPVSQSTEHVARIENTQQGKPSTRQVAQAMASGGGGALRGGGWFEGRECKVRVKVLVTETGRKRVDGGWRRATCEPWPRASSDIDWRLPATALALYS